jgi:hypothetical protein
MRKVDSSAKEGLLNAMKSRELNQLKMKNTKTRLGLSKLYQRPIYNVPKHDKNSQVRSKFTTQCAMRMSSDSIATLRTLKMFI